MDWTTQGGSAPANYDSFLVPAMFAPLAEHLVQAAGIGAGMRVLDIACGTGALARAAARAAGATGAVTAVDLSEPMLEVARAHAPESGAAPIGYLAAPAEDLPLDANETFDVITCQQGLQFFPDRPGALSAMRSRLAAGGLVAIATWTALEETLIWSSLADAVARHVGAEAGEMLRAPYALADQSELSSLLTDAGFTDVRVTSHTLLARFADRAAFAERTVMSGPVAGLFGAATAEQRALVAADVALAVKGLPGGAELHAEMTTNVAIGRG